MATIVILGAGIGGMSQAYELKQQLGRKHRIVVINDSDRFEFTPSNPWVAVGWRTQKQITVDLPPVLNKHGIEFIGQAAAQVHPDRNEVELADGECVPYDYLVIATGPKLAFDEIPGLGPDGHTESICKTAHAALAGEKFEDFVRNPAYPNIYAVGVCVAFVALPQIPPRNTNWASKGKWVHLAKVGFEKYFIRKIRNGKAEPYYEKLVLKMMGIDKLKA